MQDIISTVSYSGGSIDGSGTADTLCYFTDSNTIATFSSYLTNFSNATMKIGSVTAATGAGNTAYGVRAMDAVSTGDDNTVIGFQAGNVMDGAHNNVLVGKDAGLMITNATYNVAIGSRAFATNANGDYAVAVGHRALETEADNWNNYNVAIGADAMRFTATNDGGNTAIGAKTLMNMTTGTGNVAIGHEALENCSEDNYCVAIGYQALEDQDTSANAYNVAVGYKAGENVSTGVSNTLIGAKAGNSGVNDLTTGANNIIIGHDAAASAAGVSNEITLGNSSIAMIRAQVTTITALSDERDKKDIVDLRHGLDLVKSLKPREFVWDHRAETTYEIETSRDSKGDLVETRKEVEKFSSRKGSKDIGFVAQELQSVDDEWMQLVNASNPDKLEASYGKLVPVLVKAIQELSAKVTVLENQ
jgi:hypothetical protein